MIRVLKNLSDIPPRKQFRERLEQDFNSKCCYCEDNHIKGEIEHFLPKFKFQDLEHVWENLLWACHDCNNIKGDKYDAGNPILNPTKDEPEGLLNFDLHGNISDNNSPMAASSIKTCDLNRPNLRDKRKTVIDDFIRHLEFIAECGTKVDVIKYIQQFLIEDLVGNPKQSFIAFRKHIILHHLSDILRRL